MKFKTKGLVLKQQNIGERDRLVWVLTEDRGAKNIKTLSAPAQGFCHTRP